MGSWLPGVSRGGHGQNPLRMSAQRAAGGVAPWASPYPLWEQVVCPLPARGDCCPRRFPVDLVSRSLSRGPVCPVHSGLRPASLGSGGLSTVRCLQLIRKKVLDASVQELLGPLNLDFKSPLEKAGAQAGLPGLPTGAAWRPRGAVPAQTTPRSQMPSPARKVLERQGEALLIPWLLQDTQTQPAGQARGPGLRTLGPQGCQLPRTRGTGSRPARPAPGLGVR